MIKIYTQDKFLQVELMVWGEFNVLAKDMSGRVIMNKLIVGMGIFDIGEFPSSGMFNVTVRGEEALRCTKIIVS